jgi:predicted SAM-dependent methyltransferase
VSQTILNLACGCKTSDKCVNIDWSFYLRVATLPLGSALAPLIFNGARLGRYKRLSKNLMAHDLSKGIPYRDSSVDVVYHSHFLEHLDRATVPGFLREVSRVLKPGGIHRLVVPDLNVLCQSYLDSYRRRKDGIEDSEVHETYISRIIEQMVTVEAFGTSQQPTIRRFIENLLLGDARDRGHVHRWMYDDISLGVLLKELGFGRVTVCTFETSGIPHWPEIGLDVDEGGREYKPGSLYMEAQK